VMTEKRFHSAEDEVPVKKMYVPDDSLTAPAEQQQAGSASTATSTQSVQTSSSAAQPTTFKSVETSSTLQPTPFKDVGSFVQNTAAPVTIGSNGSSQSTMAATPFKSVDTTEAKPIASPFASSTESKIAPTEFTESKIAPTKSTDISAMSDASAPVQFKDVTESIQSTTQRPPLNTNNTGTFLSYR
ncbi:hypothetical protein KCU64_g13812, partial [Aureobasidium melanogenum]